MPQVYAIDGLVPVVNPSAFVHESAVLIGDVIVGARAYVGPAACLRGDFGRIVVEEGANIQDSCLLHGFPGKDTVVGPESTIGHGAVLHGCVIRRGALVGMNAVVNDNAEARVPPRSLAAGIPARVLRELSAAELGWKRDNMRLYQQLAERSRGTMRRVEALAAPEPGRRRIEIPGAIPLSEMKAGAKR
jgi:phenylacetic acid degradation protein